MGDKWWEKDTPAGDKPAEWWSSDKQAPAKGEEPGYLEDIARASGAGLAEGAAALAGTPRAIGDLSGSVYDWAANKMGISPEASQGFKKSALEMTHPISQVFTESPTSSDVMKKLSDLTGGATDYEAQTLPGEIAQRASSFVPAAAAAWLSGGASTLPEVLGYGVAAPTVGGMVAQPATEAAARAIGLENPERYGQYGRIAGELMAPMAASKMVGRIGAEIPAASQDRLKDIQKLEDFGIPVTSGSYFAPGAPREAAVSSELSNPLLAGVHGSQDEHFTRGIVSSLGISDDVARRYGYRGGLTPDNMEDVLKKGSDEVGSLIGSIYDKAVPGQAMPLINSEINKIRTQFSLQPPVAPISFGQQLHTVRRDLNDIITGSVDNPMYKTKSAVDNARHLKDELDKIIEQSVGPSEFAKLETANDLYSRMSIVRNAFSTADRSGVISPDEMVKAIGKSTSKPQDMEEVSRLAQRYLIAKGIKPSPMNMRGAIKYVLDALGGISGAVGFGSYLSGSALSPMTALAGLGAGLASHVAQSALSRVRNSVPMTALTQAAAKNRAIYGEVPSSAYLAPRVMALSGPDDRQGRKTGGRVSSHEAAADQLVMAAERAKKEQSAQTEGLLNQSDDAVAHALEVANRSI